MQKILNLKKIHFEFYIADSFPPSSEHNSEQDE